MTVITTKNGLTPLVSKIFISFFLLCVEKWIMGLMIMKPRLYFTTYTFFSLYFSVNYYLFWVHWPCIYLPHNGQENMKRTTLTGAHIKHNWMYFPHSPKNCMNINQGKKFVHREFHCCQIFDCSFHEKKMKELLMVSPFFIQLRFAGHG